MTKELTQALSAWSAKVDQIKGVSEQIALLKVELSTLEDEERNLQAGVVNAHPETLRDQPLSFQNRVFFIRNGRVERTGKVTQL